jgi:hypothetical protein
MIQVVTVSLFLVVEVPRIAVIALETNLAAEAVIPEVD